MKFLRLLTSACVITALACSSFGNQDPAKKGTRLDGARLIFNLKEGEVSQSGDLALDRSYSVTVEGFNRLRKQVTVTVAGKDLFREAAGPFKPPSNTKPDGDTSGGSEDIAMSVLKVDVAIKVLEGLRNRALRIQDRAYDFESLASSDYSTVLDPMLEELKKQLAQFYTRNPDFSSDPRLTTGFVGAVRQVLSKVKTMTASAAKEALLSKEDDYMTMAIKASTLFDQIQSRTLDHLTVGPFQSTNDVVTATVKVRDVARDGSVATDEMTFAHDFRVNSGFKIDFSAGIFYTNITDFDYKVVPLGTDPQTYQVQASGPGGTIGTATFVHFRGLLGGSQDYGLSLGMALQERPYYLLGVSLHSASTRQRLVLTAGVSARSVTRYEGPATIPSTDFQTTSKLRFGGFVAISYNF